ncbi:coactosin-like protein, partial [Orbicella faveolata]|uniref:coactosin-like protein n=1 Tax=Orbicella faveolata TaxID=48498 RepID=UPI0009E35BCD
SVLDRAVLKYDDKTIVLVATGKDYEEFRSHFAESDRAYGFVRIETGDELSKRAKFAFITWIGESVSGILKGKVSTDKSIVKQVIQNFAAEISTSDKEELELNHVKELVVKAGGANYGSAK